MNSSTFVCIWQILSNYEVTRLKRFVSIPPPTFVFPFFLEHRSYLSWRNHNSHLAFEFPRLAPAGAGHGPTRPPARRLATGDPRAAWPLEIQGGPHDLFVRRHAQASGLPFVMQALTGSCVQMVRPWRKGGVVSWLLLAFLFICLLIFMPQYFDYWSGK
jgi:hypothetical protein